MSEFISLFSKNEAETRLLIQSKPLILFLLAAGYLFLIYFFGFGIATVAIPMVGIAFAKCNKHFAPHK
jgi:hypothetical protein